MLSISFRLVLRSETAQDPLLDISTYIQIPFLGRNRAYNWTKELYVVFRQDTSFDIEEQGPSEQ